MPPQTQPTDERQAIGTDAPSSGKSPSARNSMPRPRIALVTHDVRASGGMDLVVRELIRHASAEVDFTVVASTLSEDLRHLVRWQRVPAISRPAPLKFLMFFVLAGIRLSRIKADLVHSMGAIVPNRVDIAWVQHCWAGVRDRSHTLAPPGTPFLRRLNTAMTVALSLFAERWCFRPRRTRLFAASSMAIRKELAHYYPGVSISLAPNGVDTCRFVPSLPGRTAMRQSQGLHPGEVVVLFVGGDWHRKGLAVAIRSLALLKGQTPEPIRLWVVGRGDERHFQRLARELGVDDRVSFFRQPLAVEPFYQAADVFLLPSHYEGFSLVAFEAAACGLPVVATRVGCVEEVVGAEEGGLIVEAKADTVAAALYRLAANPVLRQHMAEVARTRASSFTWERSAESIVRLYQQLLAAWQAGVRW